MKKIYDIEEFETQEGKEYAVFHEGIPVMGHKNLGYIIKYILKDLKGKYKLYKKN